MTLYFKPTEQKLSFISVSLNSHRFSILVDSILIWGNYIITGDASYATDKKNRITLCKNLLKLGYTYVSYLQFCKFNIGALRRKIYYRTNTETYISTLDNPTLTNLINYIPLIVVQSHVRNMIQEKVELRETIWDNMLPRKYKRYDQYLCFDANSSNNCGSCLGDVKFSVGSSLYSFWLYRIFNNTIRIYSCNVETAETKEIPLNPTGRTVTNDPMEYYRAAPVVVDHFFQADGKLFLVEGYSDNESDNIYSHIFIINILTGQRDYIQLDIEIYRKSVFFYNNKLYYIEIGSENMFYWDGTKSNFVCHMYNIHGFPYFQLIKDVYISISYNYDRKTHYVYITDLKTFNTVHYQCVSDLCFIFYDLKNALLNNTIIFSHKGRQYNYYAYDMTIRALIKLDKYPNSIVLMTTLEEVQHIPAIDTLTLMSSAISFAISSY